MILACRGTKIRQQSFYCLREMHNYQGVYGLKRIKAVLFDYGCVLSTEQVRREVEVMLDLTKVNEELFTDYYYRYRLDYDAGISGKEYWGRVLSSCKVGYDEELILRLIDHDINSWTALNQEALDWATELKKDGYKLGVISNMPVDILRYMKENFSWLKSNLFDTLVFSCDLGICISKGLGI